MLDLVKIWRCEEDVNFVKMLSCEEDEGFSKNLEVRGGCLASSKFRAVRM